MQCFMCGLGPNVVKLTTVRVTSTKESRSGKATPGNKTVCEHCKVLLLSGNHPENQNLAESPEQQGYIKPSNPEEQGGGAYPPVRPQ
jgi:hypothetical protein